MAVHFCISHPCPLCRTQDAWSSWPIASVPATKPLDGFVMEPEGSRSIIPEAASIICGHDFIQALGEDKMLEFEMFIREVLTSLTTNRLHR